MTKIKLEIKNCKQCPFFKIKYISSTDGWDRGEDWFCSKENKMIEPFVEWHEEKNIEVPEWCPIKVD